MSKNKRMFLPEQNTGKKISGQYCHVVGMEHSQVSYLLHDRSMLDFSLPIFNPYGFYSLKNTVTHLILLHVRLI